MARRPDPNSTIRPFRVWSVNGSDPVGAVMQYAGQCWIIYSWDKRHRVLTLVNLSGSVSLIDPYCMQWEK
jgi:hypothetical protein